MQNKIKILFVTSSLFLPLVSFGQTTYLRNTSTISGSALDIVNRYLIPIAFALALLYFFWGVAQYIRSAGTEKEEGRKIMVWGVIALFVMSSVWGLVLFIRDEFNILGSEDNAIIPTATK